MSSPAYFRHAKLVRTAHLPIFFLFIHDCFVFPDTNLQCSFVADSKGFLSDFRVVHVRDLNVVLKFEIFVHVDGQLRASHLIIGCTPYTRLGNPSAKPYW